MVTGRIPENIIDEVLNRVDIVELISGYIPLKRAGRNFRALCPFHHEKTPSFMISPDRQIYHCFGCGKGGNAFNFLMQYERMEFPEAVEALAKKAGIALPEKEKQDSKVSGLVTQLYKINELTALFYENSLNSPEEGSAAKNYLLKRGITAQSLKLFKLGYAPDKWEGLINYLRSKEISLSLLEKAGLITAKNNGGYHDLFHHRIILPIFDIKERVIAFGARMFSAAGGVKNPQPKYINSPETPIYVKGRNLYGLNFSKDAIRQSDCAVVVEGYLDFIIPYQQGLKNIVASLGTALTDEQIRLIKRYTHNVVMVYDADTAGQAATLRALDMFIEEGINVKVAWLPEGFDPDALVRKNGSESFKKIISEAVNLFDYKLRILMKQYNPKDIEGKAMISSDMLQTINKFKNAILKSEYLKKLSSELDVSEDSLWQEIKKVKEGRPYLESASREPKKLSQVNPTEKLLMQLMLEETEFINRVRDSLTPQDFQDGRIARIVSLMFELALKGKNVNASTLINSFSDDSVTQIICESTLLKEGVPQDRETVLEDCIQRIKKEKLKLKRQQMQEEIRVAQNLGNEGELNRLIQEFQILTKER